MAPYHAVLVHFPVALWTTAALVILVRALSAGALARAADRALVPLLALSVLAGLAAYLVGLFVWPLEAVAASPLGRNHVLAATWSLAYWTLLLLTRWRKGEAIWQGVNRWVMLGLGALGAVLLTVTGTLGGHLTGKPTAVSQVLHWLGWDVYHTYYVPDITLGVLVVAIVALPVIGWWGSRRVA